MPSRPRTRGGGPGDRRGAARRLLGEAAGAETVPEDGPSSIRGAVGRGEGAGDAPETAPPRSKHPARRRRLPGPDRSRRRRDRRRGPGGRPPRALLGAARRSPSRAGDRLPRTPRPAPRSGPRRRPPPGVLRRLLAGSRLLELGARDRDHRHDRPPARPGAPRPRPRPAPRARGSLGGYVASSQVREEGSDLGGTVVVDVPAGRLSTLMGDAGRLGSVRSSSSSAKDVTGEVVDLGARLSALEGARSRLDPSPPGPGRSPASSRWRTRSRASRPRSSRSKASSAPLPPR